MPQSSAEQFREATRTANAATHGTGTGTNNDTGTGAGAGRWCWALRRGGVQSISRGEERVRQVIVAVQCSGRAKVQEAGREQQ